MRTETVSERTVPERVVQSKQVKITCDLCPEAVTTSTYGSRGYCQLCRRDVCKNCRVLWDCDPLTGYDNGDYPPTACRECDESAKAFAPKYNELIEQADALESEWIASRKLCTEPTATLATNKALEGDGSE